MAELRENEQKTLLALQTLQGRAPVDQIAQSSGLAHAAVMRGVLSLTENKLIETHEQKQTLVTLTEEGSYHAENGLPERRLLDSLEKLGGEAKVNSVVEGAGLEKKFVSVALGWLNRKGWAKIEQGTLKPLKEASVGADEKVLKQLTNKSPLVVEELPQDLQKSISLLKGRRLVDVEEKTLRELELTEQGWTLVKSGIERAKLLEVIPIRTVPVTKATLVVGGGIAGMNAALDLANQGIKVYLVEKKTTIGGRMAQLDRTFPTDDCAI